MAGSNIPSASFFNVRSILVSSVRSLQKDHKELSDLIAEGLASSCDEEDCDIVFGSLRILQYLQLKLEDLRYECKASEGDE